MGRGGLRRGRARHKRIEAHLVKSRGYAEKAVWWADPVLSAGFVPGEGCLGIFGRYV